jgi:hypothetical protein
MRKALGSANRIRRVGRDDAIAKDYGRLAESIRAHDVAFDQVTLNGVAARGVGDQGAAPLLARENVVSASGGPADDVFIL